MEEESPCTDVPIPEVLGLVEAVVLRRLRRVMVVREIYRAIVDCLA